MLAHPSVSPGPVHPIAEGGAGAEAFPVLGEILGHRGGRADAGHMGRDPDRVLSAQRMGLRNGFLAKDIEDGPSDTAELSDRKSASSSTVPPRDTFTNVEPRRIRPNRAALQ